MGKVDAPRARVQPDHPKSAAFEEVWAILQRTAKRQEETDRIVKDVARRQKEAAKLIGNLGGRYGEVLEYMVKPNLVKKFRELGFEFTKVYPEMSIKDKEHDLFVEVDLTLEDGDKVMIVEVKSKPSIDDVKEHVERMGKLRRHADLHADTRKYLGAVAGMVISDNARTFILKNGFYVIEPSGETFIITPPQGEPKEW